MKRKKFTVKFKKLLELLTSLMNSENLFKIFKFLQISAQTYIRFT